MKTTTMRRQLAAQVNASSWTDFINNYFVLFTTYVPPLNFRPTKACYILSQLRGSTKGLPFQ
jgi:hypothetical protein